MAVFPLLAEPEYYQANTIDLEHDRQSLLYWLALFENHAANLKPMIAATEADHGDGESKADAFVGAFHAVCDRIRREPDAYGSMSILHICELREAALRAAGVADPYRLIKSLENETAVGLLPGVLQEIDAEPQDERFALILRCMLAGNLFDLGSAQTIALFEKVGGDFSKARSELPERPWFVDDADEFISMANRRHYRKAVIFVDNAGADIVLGVVPFAREIIRRGGTAVLAANGSPSLNDITCAELNALIQKVAAVDTVLAKALEEGRLIVVDSGNSTSLIDLSCISDELVVAAHGADLVVLEGMGRALQSNYLARFTCDSLKVAMIKDENVAEHFEGRFFDVVCRFEPA